MTTTIRREDRLGAAIPVHVEHLIPAVSTPDAPA